MSDNVCAWLANCCSQGAQVLVGGPDRTHLPKAQLNPLATYTVKTIRELENSDLSRTQVFEFCQNN